MRASSNVILKRPNEFGHGRLLTSVRPFLWFFQNFSTLGKKAGKLSNRGLAHQIWKCYHQTLHCDYGDL